jgi:hypothetical protein
MAADWVRVFDSGPKSTFTQEMTPRFARLFRNLDPTTDVGCKRFANLVGISKDGVTYLQEQMSDDVFSVVSLMPDDDSDDKLDDVNELYVDSTTKTVKGKSETTRMKKTPSTASANVCGLWNLERRATVFLKWLNLQRPLVTPSSINGKIKAYEDLNVVLTHVPSSVLQHSDN